MWQVTVMPGGRQPPPTDWQARVQHQLEQQQQQLVADCTGRAVVCLFTDVRRCCCKVRLAADSVWLLLVSVCAFRLGGGNFGVTYEAIKLTVSLLAAHPPSARAHLRSPTADSLGKVSVWW